MASLNNLAISRHKSTDQFWMDEKSSTTSTLHRPNFLTPTNPPPASHRQLQKVRQQETQKYGVELDGREEHYVLTF